MDDVLERLDNILKYPFSVLVILSTTSRLWNTTRSIFQIVFHEQIKNVKFPIIQATGQLSVSFRNMSLKKIKRAEKKGTESVRLLLLIMSMLVMMMN